MKHIKLLSALTLSAALLTAASGAVSAAVVDKTTNQAIEKTDGSAGFIVDKTTPITPEVPGSKGGGPDTKDPKDPTTPDGPDGPLPAASDLSLYRVPKEFNFGIQKVSAADKVSGVTLTQKNGFQLIMMLMVTAKIKRKNTQWITKQSVLVMVVS